MKKNDFNEKKEIQPEIKDEEEIIFKPKYALNKLYKKKKKPDKKGVSFKKKNEFKIIQEKEENPVQTDNDNLLEVEYDIVQEKEENPVQPDNDNLLEDEIIIHEKEEIQFKSDNLLEDEIVIQEKEEIQFKNNNLFNDEYDIIQEKEEVQDENNNLFNNEYDIINEKEEIQFKNNNNLDDEFDIIQEKEEYRIKNNILFNDKYNIIQEKEEIQFKKKHFFNDKLDIIQEKKEVQDENQNIIDDKLDLIQEKEKVQDETINLNEKPEMKKTKFDTASKSTRSKSHQNKKINKTEVIAKIDVEKEKTNFKLAQREKKTDFNNLYAKRQSQNYLLMDIISFFHLLVFSLLVSIGINATYGNRINWKIQRSFDIDKNLEPHHYNDYTLYANRIIENFVDIFSNGFHFDEGKLEIVSNIRITKRVNRVNNYTGLYLKLPMEVSKKLKSSYSMPIFFNEGYAGDEIETKKPQGKYNYIIENCKIFYLNQIKPLNKIWLFLIKF